MPKKKNGDSLKQRNRIALSYTYTDTHTEKALSLVLGILLKI